MRRRVGPLAVVMLTSVVGCRSSATTSETISVPSTAGTTGSSSPSSIAPPPPTISPPSTTTTTRSLVRTPASNITFQHDAGVTSEELDHIRRIMAIAQSELGDAGPVTVYAYDDLEELLKTRAPGGGIEAARARYSQGSVGEAGAGGKIVIYMPTFRTFQDRERLVMHEYFHTIQSYLLGSSINTEPFSQVPKVGPVWILEGTAEYVSSKLADSHGFGSYTGARQRAIRVARTSPSLEMYETWESTNSAPQGSIYSVGLLAAEFIETKYGGDDTKYSYWRALAKHPDWRTAFSDAFGVSIDDFYGEFAAHRQTI